MSYKVANRNGVPAYVNAPPRLRASQIERKEEPKPTTPLVLRLIKWMMGGK